jgi:hypothetical protein
MNLTNALKISQVNIMLDGGYWASAGRYPQATIFVEGKEYTATEYIATGIHKEGDYGKEYNCIEIIENISRGKLRGDFYLEVASMFNWEPLCQ